MRGAAESPAGGDLRDGQVAQPGVGEVCVAAPQPLLADPAAEGGAFAGDKLSRVTSWDALGAFALEPVGLVLVGPVSATLGTQHTLICAGSLVAIANLGALLTRSVRRLPARPQPTYGSEAPPNPGPLPASS